MEYSDIKYVLPIELTRHLEVPKLYYEHIKIPDEPFEIPIECELSIEVNEFDKERNVMVTEEIIHIHAFILPN